MGGGEDGIEEGDLLAHRLVAHHGLVPAVSAEDLVSPVSRQRDLDRSPGEPRELEDRQRGRVVERLVVHLGGAVERRRKIADVEDLLAMVRAEGPGGDFA